MHVLSEAGRYGDLGRSVSNVAQNVGRRWFFEGLTSVGGDGGSAASSTWLREETG